MWRYIYTHACMYNINDKIYVEMLCGGIYTLMHACTILMTRYMLRCYVEVYIHMHACTHINT